MPCLTRSSRIEKAERSDDSFKHNLMGQVKEENEKIVSVITGLIEKLQEEREEETATEPKKKGAVSSVMTLAIMLRIALTRKKGNQQECTIPKEGATIRKGIRMLPTRNPIKYHPTSRMENQNRTVPPLPSENKTVTVTTVGNRDIGHRNAQSKTFPHSIRSSGMI